MVISVNDIQSKEFERSFRGYHIDDVDDFLENLALDYDTALKENKELREYLVKLKREGTSFKENDDNLDRERETVEKEIERIKVESAAEVERLRDEKAKEIERLSQEYKNLSRENEDLRQQILELKTEGMGFDKIEDTIQSAIARSQEAAEEVLANARKDAANIREKADTHLAEAEKIKVDAAAEIEKIAGKNDELLRDNRKLNESLNELKERNRKYQQLEETVQNAILIAQKKADEIKENAVNEAKSIIELAEKEAARITQEARLESADILREHEGINKEIKIFKKRFRSFIESQLSSLEKDGIKDTLEKANFPVDFLEKDSLGE